MDTVTRMTEIELMDRDLAEIIKRANGRTVRECRATKEGRRKFYAGLPISMCNNVRERQGYQAAADAEAERYAEAMMDTNDRRYAGTW